MYATSSDITGFEQSFPFSNLKKGVSHSFIIVLNSITEERIEEASLYLFGLKLFLTFRKVATAKSPFGTKEVFSFIFKEGKLISILSNSINCYVCSFFIHFSDSLSRLTLVILKLVFPFFHTSSSSYEFSLFQSSLLRKTKYIKN